MIAAMPWDPISKVLDDDDLLREIIVRLGLPTSLVRAAMVCKHWLRLASDPAFLRRFRKLHPPHLLGFYVSNTSNRNPPFVPMPQSMPLPPELASVIRRAVFNLDNYSNSSTRTRIVDCWGGSIFVTLHNSECQTEPMLAVLRPLCAQRGTAIFMPSTCQQLQDGNIRNICMISELLSREGDGSLSYLWMDFAKERATVHIYRLQKCVWAMHTSATTEFHGLPLSKKLLRVDSNVYICAPSYILVFDLIDLSFSKIQYPQEVGFPKEIMLSHANDANGLHLIHAKEFQLGIWLHKGGKWLMVDNICLRKMYVDLKISYNKLPDEGKVVVRISQVGPNTEFVFLQVGRFILYLDIKCTMLHKVHHMTMMDRVLGHPVHPIMIWPPIFPSRKDDHARDATTGWGRSWIKLD